MSALPAFSGLFGGAGGGGGGASPTATSGDAANRSINILGVGGGTQFDLNQFLQTSVGPSANGGFTDLLRPSRLTSNIGSSENPISSNMLPLIIGGVALVLLVILVKKS